MNFKQPLLLHPLQKHNEGAEDVDGVSLGIFFWAISKKKKKIFFLALFLFSSLFLIFIFFSAASSASSFKKTL